MKKFIQIMVLGALMLFSPYSNAAPTNVDKQFFDKVESLENGGFENGKAGWTASAGAFSLVTGSSALVGSTSARFNASATAQTVCSKLYTVPKGIQGLPALGSFKYTTTEGTNKYKVTVYDGSSVLISTNTLDSSTNANMAYAPFSAPTSGTYKVCIESTGDAADIDFDFGHLGSDTRLSDVSQAQFMGAVKVTGCNVTYSRQSATYGDQTSNPTGCTATTSGKATWTSGPSITFSSLDAGDYLIELDSSVGRVNTTNGDGCFFRFTDGTNNADAEGYVSAVAGATALNIPKVSGRISYTSTQSNVTFKLNMKGDSATPTCQALALTGYPLSIRVYKFPSSTETGVRIDQLGWRVDANISGANPSLGTASVSTYTGIEDAGLTLTNNTGNAVIAAQIPCSSTNAPTGTTCAAGNESVGVSFNVPNAGDVKACAYFGWYGQRGGSSGDKINATFQLVETHSNAQTILQEGKSRAAAGTGQSPTNPDNPSNVTMPVRVCGNFTFASSGQKTIRLMYEQEAVTAQNSSILADASAANGQRDIHWEVYPINYLSGAMPIYKGMVTSKTSGRQRIESFTFGGASNPSACTGSPCTVYTSSAPVTVTRSGTGIYSAVFTEAFGGVINCTAMMISGANSGHFLTSGTSSTTTYGFDGRVSSSAANQDMGGSVICMGAN